VLDLQAVSDRLEIDDLLTAYTCAVDAAGWDRLDEVFTPDAWIDYTATGGIAGRFPEVKEWLARTRPVLTAMQHYVAQRQVRLDGDRAEARAAMINTLVTDRDDGSRWWKPLGGVHVHDLVRTPQGWRSESLVEELRWDLGSD
jgi:hypothetical protein